MCLLTGFPPARLARLDVASFMLVARLSVQQRLVYGGCSLNVSVNNLMCLNPKHSQTNPDDARRGGRVSNQDGYHCFYGIAKTDVQEYSNASFLGAKWFQ